MFRQRYPTVRLDESHMLVNSGAFVTAGAALSHVDMALFLVRQVSPELAAMVAWLSSEDCAFSTGAVFDISGGRATY